MIRFTIYTYSFKPINAPIEKEMYKPDINLEESVKNKLEIFGSFFNFDSHIILKYGNQQYDHNVVAKREDIIVMQIANNSKLVHEHNFNRREEDHPSLYVLIDNREDRQIIAIENRTQAFAETKTVANILMENFNRLLWEYGLELTIDAKFHTHEFWDVAAECKDGVASVKFKFPYPNLAVISDLVGEYYKQVAKSTNGEPTTILTARPKERLTLEEGDTLVEKMISAASASGKLIMMRPKGQRKWKQIGLKTIVHEEISEQVFAGLEEGEIIPRRWFAIMEFMNRIKQIYTNDDKKE